MYREKTVCYKCHVPFIFVFLFLRSNYDCNVLRQLNFHANSLLMLHEYSGVYDNDKTFFFSPFNAISSVFLSFQINLISILVLFYQ